VQSELPICRYTLPARLRVRRASSFQEAYKQGDKTVGRFVVLWLWSGEGACGRLGVVASKKVGNSVARSKGKRRMREWFRLNRHRLCDKDDFILVARRSILTAKQPDLDADMESVFSRARQLQTPPECTKESNSSP
jgi:ribonuclease P protein component